MHLMYFHCALFLFVPTQILPYLKLYSNTRNFFNPKFQEIIKDDTLHQFGGGGEYAFFKDVNFTPAKNKNKSNS